MEGLNGCVFVPLEVQHPRTDVKTAWFPSCQLSICMAALVELQAAWGQAQCTLGSLGPGVPLCWKGGFLSLGKPLLQPSHTEELRLDMAKRSALSRIIKTKIIFLYEAERRIGCTLPFLVGRTSTFVCCKTFSFLFILFCSWMKN